MRQFDPSEPVTVTPAELKMLEALIELEEEERSGAAESITIYDSPDALAFWAAAGKWVWKNRYKLLAATQAVVDLAGGIRPLKASELQDASDLGQLLAGTGEASLDDLLAAREQIYRAMRDQRASKGKSEKELD